MNSSSSKSSHPHSVADARAREGNREGVGLSPLLSGRRRQPPAPPPASARRAHAPLIARRAHARPAARRAHAQGGGWAKGEEELRERERELGVRERELDLGEGCRFLQVRENEEMDLISSYFLYYFVLFL